MHMNYAEDVLEAYQCGLALLSSDAAVTESSRAGEVRVWPTPVMTVTGHPERCVLLDRNRRANPFFHVYEALWMLCGRRDARMLDRFVSNFSSRFAEESGNQHGAYGHRWRYHWSMDQVRVACERLKRNYRDRRVVISMWDPDTDLARPEEYEPRDVPCNTHIYPRITRGRLHLTVCCRSNDAIWGAHGANAVHFSFLLQYMAARIGVGIGLLYQLSNNYHMYTETAREPDPAPPQAPWDRMLPTVDEPWRFMDSAEEVVADPLGARPLDTWVRDVAQHMFLAHDAWREGDREKFFARTTEIKCPVWRMAAQQWWSE